MISFLLFSHWFYVRNLKFSMNLPNSINSSPQSYAKVYIDNVEFQIPLRDLDSTEPPRKRALISSEHWLFVFVILQAPVRHQLGSSGCRRSLLGEEVPSRLLEQLSILSFQAWFHFFWNTPILHMSAKKTCLLWLKVQVFGVFSLSFTPLRTYGECKWSSYLHSSLCYWVHFLAGDVKITF